MKAIALIDGNNFYASCEESIDPSLIGHPVVVLSSNNGCIIARNAEARKLKIKMGTPYFKIKNELYKLGVIVKSSNYSLYGDMSQRFMSLLTKYSEIIEIYSIDEAFIQISRPKNKNLNEWGRQIRAIIYQSLGLPISIGIGKNKCQAKIANHIAKKDASKAGIFDIGILESQDEYLSSVEIEDVWGIGNKMSKWLRRKGIDNARKLREMKSSELKRKYGVVAIRIQQELNGFECMQIVNQTNKKKEMCISRSYSSPIVNIEESKKIISNYAVHLAAKLREQNQLTKQITVFIRTSPFRENFYSNSSTLKLNNPSNETSIILKSSIKLLEKIYQTNYPPNKLGIIVKKLEDKNYFQPSLFTNFKSEGIEKRDRLLETIDRINNRFGENSLRWAICGQKTSYNIRKESLSSLSTTDIKNIPIVVA
tara:strand:- start:31 stop:1302 length:1272 start_codon:yes stop_codon:yes gene_type:complete